MEVESWSASLKSACLVTADGGGNAFTEVLFLGKELSLQFFLLSFFSLVDLLASDFVLAAILTFLIDMVGTRCRLPSQADG